MKSGNAAGRGVMQRTALSVGVWPVTVWDSCTAAAMGDWCQCTWLL